MLGPFLQGIQKAGFLKSASWQNQTLKVKLNSDTLYGEIATRSRVPLMWKVDKGLNFRVSKTDEKTVVDVEGLSIWSSAQALSIYQQALNAANLEGSSCHGSLQNWTCIKTEIEAAGKYLDIDWAKRMTKDNRKVTNVLNFMMSSAQQNWALKVSNKWPTVFYSIITTVPRKIVSFEFQNGKVSAVAALDETHPASADYERLHLFEKAEIMGARSLLDTPKMLFNMAVSQATSGMNLAMMLSSGNPMTRGSMKKKGIEAGDPHKIGNLMGWCKGSAPGSDPKCQGGTPGRVAWGPNLPENMGMRTDPMLAKTKTRWQLLRSAGTRTDPMASLQTRWQMLLSGQKSSLGLKYSAVR